VSELDPDLLGSEIALDWLNGTEEGPLADATRDLVGWIDDELDAASGQSARSQARISVLEEVRREAVSIQAGLDRPVTIGDLADPFGPHSARLQSLLDRLHRSRDQ
jgi:hypothetical protein